MKMTVQGPYLVAHLRFDSQLAIGDLCIRLDLRELISTAKRILLRAIQRMPSVRAAIVGDLLADDDLTGADALDLIGGRKERVARRRRKRKERRKRVAGRFKRAMKKVVKAVARLRIVDRLRDMLKGMRKSKLVQGLFRAAIPAVATAFGGPQGGQLAAQLGMAMLPAPQGPSLYQLGCGK